MKHKKTILFSALLAALSLTATAGVTAMAEKVSVDAPKSSNVVSGLSADAFSATDYSGNAIEHIVVGPNQGAGRTYTIENINNGDKSSWDVIAPSANGTDKTLAWFNVDLGKVYTVDKVLLTMNHDWSGRDVVIQVATQADFSDAVTIYNNDADNSLGCGATFTADASIPVSESLANFGNAGASLDGNGNIFSFTPTAARYVRVTNNQFGNGGLQGFTAVGEIEVYGYNCAATPATTSEVAPVAFSKVAGAYTENISVELSSDHADADIYYTTDGSVPTTDSEKYTGAITVQKGYSKMIRASAYVNGVMGLPVTAEYVVQDEMIGKNVALNKPVKVVSKDMTQDWSDNLYAISKPTEAGANAVTRINDGSFDMWYAISTHNQAALGWAVIDFGAEYYIDYVVYEAYWDWWMGNNIIEISTTENFTAETTVRIYDNAGGIQTGVASGNKGMQIDANVKGRYLRVTNDKEGGGTISAFTEIQAIAGKEPEAGSLVGTNVALNKDIKFVSYDMSADWSDNLYAINKSGEAGANTVGHINDGSFDFWYALSSQKAGGKGWAIIDLGAEYYLDYLVYDAYHDWDIGNHIIKVASKADYSDAVTIHNNEGAYRTGGGKQIDANVKGRYILVSNAVARNETENVEATVLTEIQAFVGEEPEATEQIYLKSYETFADIEVANGTLLEDIALPTSLTVTMSDGSTKTLEGACSAIDGYTGKAGTYTTTFTVTDTDALCDVFGIYKDIEIVIKVAKLQPTIAISVADRIVCDGNAPTVSIEASLEGYTVQYYQGETLLDAAPTTAGSYTVVVSLAETDNSEAASSRADFTMVDYRALSAKIDEVVALNENAYMSASWATLSEALGSAQTVLGNDAAVQTEIDGAIESLVSAVNALVLKGNKTALQEKYDAVKDIENVYTSASWTTFNAALTEAKALLDTAEATQATIDAELADLTAAHGALVVKANFTALQTAVDAAKALTLDSYVTAGKDTFTAALTAAEAILANDETAQNDIDAAKTALEAAQAALVLKGDKTALNALVAEVDALAEADYTAATWATLSAKLTAAKAVVADADATQADVDVAKADLEAAKTALVLAGDKTALNALIAEVEALAEADYTAATWATLSAKLTAAKAVAADANATQADVDAAKADLEAAKTALVLKGDKTALNALIAEVEALAEADYTAATWATLSAKLTAAKAVAADADATQADVDAAKADLEAAKTALELKPAPVEEGGCGSTVAAGAVALATVAFAGLLISKKKKED